MTALKYSRQRESIKQFLSGRTDHPTADVIYTHLREEFPNISLGTVYRNLALLSNLGEILKLSTGNGADHFDGNTSPHYHFVCNECNRIYDLNMETINHINLIAAENFDGQIDGHIAYFYGKCSDCVKK